MWTSVFKRGSAVEVSSEDEGLRGSWYTATVVDNSGPKLVVEYHNLNTDEDDGSSKLREEVDPILVRPVPPLDPNPVFRLMDDVDAFHNDGWWEGVVTALHPDSDSDSSSYSVFFRCSREQIDFPPAHMRLHREWLGDDLWRPPFQPQPPPPPSSSSSSSSSSSRSRPKRKNGDGGQDDGGGRKTIRKGALRRRHIQQPPPPAPAHCRPGMHSRTAALLCNNTPHITRNGSLKEPPPRAASLSGRRASTH